MSEFLGWMVFIIIGIAIYNAGMFFGGLQQSCNIWPVIILLVVTELVALVTTINKRKK